MQRNEIKNVKLPQRSSQNHSHGINDMILISSSLVKSYTDKTLMP